MRWQPSGNIRNKRKIFEKNEYETRKNTGAINTTDIILKEIERKT